MMRLTLWERRHVATLQAKLGEGGDLAKSRIGPLVIGQCMAVSHAQVRKGSQKPEAFGHQQLEKKMIPNDATHLQEGSG